MKVQTYDRKLRSIAMSNAGKCERCVRPLDSDKPRCEVCREKHRARTAKAYWQGKERKRTIHCGECDKPGHNVVTCSMAKR